MGKREHRGRFGRNEKQAGRQKIRLEKSHKRSEARNKFSLVPIMDFIRINYMPENFMSMFVDADKLLIKIDDGDCNKL